MADKAIATTWGFDLLVAEQIHCVEEKRLYPVFDQRDIKVEAKRVQQSPVKHQPAPKQ